jgi:nicotinate-nucleotide pyrophosphorylase (carboxylating)
MTRGPRKRRQPADEPEFGGRVGDQLRAADELAPVLPPDPDDAPAGGEPEPMVEPVDPLFFPLTPAQTAGLVRAALDEDEAFNDVTTLATVLPGRHARGQIVARQAGVIAGMALAVEAFRQVDPKIVMRVDVPDGVEVAAGTPVLFFSGHARGVLSAERVALNFAQRLSGVATLTARYVHAVAGTRARILDTRKTTPGWRRLEKYAVRAGGGTNHRMDLSSWVLIKDNHLAAVDGDVAFAVRRARETAPVGATVEVECDRQGQVEAALAAGADIVLLDNMPLDEMRACAMLCRGRAHTEASGGVRLDTVRAIAETGVDFVSVGALTHSAPAMDLGLDFE